MPAIAFDVDDTLYDLADPYIRAVGEFFGSDLALPLDELFVRSRIRSDEAYEHVISGEQPVEYMHIYRVQKAFGDFGVEVSAEDAIAFQRTYEKCQGSIALSPAMADLIRDCTCRGIAVGIISNGDSAHQRAKISALGIPALVPKDRIVISGDVGHCKPDVEIFRHAEERLGADPSDCWFVGDTYDCDVLGPLRAGWHCIWFNRRARILEAGDPAPDIEVATEVELISAVREVVFHG
ncbi:MAG: HAD family hydrolase [Coriobacteriaceae bacterium]|nr:HAD family hydrolase [Coriobacteriaceae bacterium]